MKSLGRYLVSLFLSVVMVFVSIAAIAALVLTVNVTSSKLCKMSDDSNLPEVVIGEIGKYYKNKYNTTGIPAEVYTSAITKEDISAEIERNIVSGFYSMEKESSESSQFSLPELENSISDFFDNYAAENGFSDTEKLEARKQSEIKSAYKVISNQCDVFRFNSLKEHGVLGKLSKVYPYRRVGVVSLLCASLLIMVIFLAVNHKEKPAMLYWTGISEIIAGIFTAVPAAVFLSSGKLSAFTIKQPQIFTAYTSEIHAIAMAFLAAGLAVLVVGIAFIILYKIFSTRDESVAPTKPLPIN
ncbi:MAG: hypothetical protein J6L99_02345 [Ruminococcus sp.]|nr:hypothetical protein [Ruminococcus sp.]